ncbi:MAG: hypothetical protein KDC38_15790, partial [Planctomycetes bacterium]|nr:hypothetical protein [Planctomycetota bacterium]
SGEITARGGAGGTADGSAGRGGGGSGGSIVVRATGDVTLGPDASIDVRGGAGGTGVSVVGGDGSDGWVRFEAAGSFSSSPLASVLPSFTSGDYLGATMDLEIVRSVGYRVHSNGALSSTVAFGSPTVTLAQPLTPGTAYRLLFESATESRVAPGAVGTYSGLVSDPSDLPPDTTHVRMRWYLFRNRVTGQGPEIDSVAVPFDL